MVRSLVKKCTGLACLLSGGYGFWLCATGEIEDVGEPPPPPDYDYVAEIRELEASGRLAEAGHLADFVLGGGNVAARAEVQDLRDSINRKRTSFWGRAYLAGKGFVVGGGSSAEELGGALVSDFLLWGDIRDLAKEGYCKAKGKETDPVVAALASVGVLTSLASFWIADPAEPAEVAADTSLSILKSLRKAGRLSKGFCGVLLDACRESAKARSASKGLKEIAAGLKSLFDGAGAARASSMMKHVKDIPSLKAVSAMASRAPEPTAILLRMHGDKGVEVLRELAGAENGANMLSAAARKGPKGIERMMSAIKTGARTGKSLRHEHPQKLLATLLAGLLPRKILAMVSALFTACGLWSLKTSGGREERD